MKKALARMEKVPREAGSGVHPIRSGDVAITARVERVVTTYLRLGRGDEEGGEEGGGL